MNKSKLPVSIVSVLLLCTSALEATVPQEADPKEVLERGKALSREGRSDEAIELLKPTTDQQRRRAQLADAHFSLGLAYYALGDFLAAGKNFAHAFALEPDRKPDLETFPPELVVMFEDVWRQTSTDPGEVMEEGGEADVFTEDGLRIPAGARVRVRLSGENGGIKGYLLKMDERQLLLTTSDQQRLRFPRNLVEKFELSKGRKNNALKGLVLGAVTGAIIGAIEKVNADCEGDECYTRAENVGYGAIGMGLMGALVGALVKTDQWIEVPMERIGIHVTTNGFHGVSVSVGLSY